MSEAGQDRQDVAKARAAAERSKFGRRRFAAWLGVASAVALSGCGQKGPLYLPEQKLEELKKKRK